MIRAVTSALAEKTLVDLGWARLTDELAHRCHTPRGEARARAIDLPTNLHDAAARSREIGEGRALHALNAAPPFAGITTIDEAVGRAEKGGTLDPAELVDVARTLSGIADLRRHLVRHAEHAPGLAARATRLRDLSHVYGPISDSFDDSGRLADHASAALGPLRRRLAQLHDELSRRVKTLIEDERIGPHLMDAFYTQREDRYVVPVRAEARSKVKGIVHGTSQSGGTVFIEPEDVVELNNRLKITESDVAEEERRILAELSGYVREEAGVIVTSLDEATELDLLDGATRLADALGASAPALGPAGGPLELKQARHPLMVLAKKPCVANDLIVPARTTLVLSGPNAGGKTVALKTMGLCAVMARAGLHAPVAEGSKAPLYRAIFTDIGDDQSLERDLSTFSAHLANLKGFLADAGDDALILLDEVATGTEPEQGAALAQAVLEALASAGAQAVITTHYQSLVALAPRDPRFGNASFEIDRATLAPTFVIRHGIPGSSGALELGRRVGLPDGVLARAAEILGDRRASVDELLVELETERARLVTARQELAAETAEASRATRRAEDDRRAARERLDQIRKGAHDETLSTLKRARDELDRVRVILRRGKDVDVHEARAADKLIDMIGRDVARAAPAGAPAAAAPLPANAIVVGARVKVAGLGASGVVLSAPDDGRVAVQIGSLRTSVALTDVVADDTPAAKTGQKKSKGYATPTPPPAASAGTTRTTATTLDLRGGRVDESLASIDRFLDDALLRGDDTVFIVHGHGTGALRTAVREHLTGHPAVSTFRPGEKGEGGDGATVVSLDL